MRVISGLYKGRQLGSLKGSQTRPTPGKVKEAVFSSLQALIPNSIWLDLFAGSGGIGIEALSRGAAFCIFAENNPLASKIIRANLDSLGLDQTKAKVLGCDAATACGIIARDQGRTIEIAYLDPPYADLQGYVKAITALESVLRPGAHIIIEHSIDFSPQLPYGIQIKAKKYGASGVTIFQKGKGD